MSAFPLLAGSEDHAAQKERVARWSVLASFALTVGKLLAGVFSGSLALLSEAAHSLIDTFATLVTWFAIRVSNKPADEDHNYGHGKIESMAALFETCFLFLLALGVLIKAGNQLLTGGRIVEATWPVFVVVVIAIIVDIERIRALARVARETGSQALAADVLHFSSDLAGSCLVFLGLLASCFGFVYGDALAAIGVACFIAIAGWRLGRRTLDTLLDAAPKGIAERLRMMALATPGVVEVRAVRLRPGGNETFGEVKITVSRTLPLDQVDAIKGDFSRAAGKEIPNLELTVIALPIALSSETIRERVLLLGQRERLPVHHVTVQDVAGRLSVSFDMEVDGRETLDAAHARAERFKKVLRGEFGENTEIEPHVEPLETVPLSGREAPAELLDGIADALVGEAEVSELIWEIHDVRARETDAGLVVNYHCRAAGNLNVASVHRHMDEMEHHVREKFPAIIRIVGHADVRNNSTTCPAAPAA